MTEEFNLSFPFLPSERRLSFSDSEKGCWFLDIINAISEGSVWKCGVVVRMLIGHGPWLFIIYRSGQVSQKLSVGGFRGPHRFIVFGQPKV